VSAKQGINLLQSRMHNNNWVHGYLTEHNVTLDAKIIDLDSVENIGEGSIRGKSIINEEYSNEIKKLNKAPKT